MHEVPLCSDEKPKKEICYDFGRIADRMVRNVTPRTITISLRATALV